MADVAIIRTSYRPWVTMTMVRPPPHNSNIFSVVFSNFASPPVMASSMSRISGSRCAATEKPSRVFMPLEYVLNGIIDVLAELRELDDRLASVARALQPVPERQPPEPDVLPAGELGCIPNPTDRRGEMRPCTTTRPFASARGCRTPFAAASTCLHRCAR